MRDSGSSGSSDDPKLVGHYSNVVSVIFCCERDTQVNIVKMEIRTFEDDYMLMLRYSEVAVGYMKEYQYSTYESQRVFLTSEKEGMRTK